MKPVIYAIFLATSVKGSTTPQLNAKADIIALESAVEMFKVRSRMLPPIEEGLRSLVERPAALGTNARWIQVLHKLPSDPWGNPYYYIAGDGFTGSFGIYSLGADGKSATQGNDPDDISSWCDDHHATQNRLQPSTIRSWMICAFTAVAGFAFGRFSVPTGPTVKAKGDGR